MKSFFAYALLVIGLPTMIGLFVGSVIAVPCAWLFPPHMRVRVMPFLAVLNGIASIFAALGLFWLFGIASGLSVPIISTAWISFYFLSYNQSRIEWLTNVAGIFIGWIIFSGLFYGR